MNNQNTSFVEIENYIRNLILKNNGIFDRDSIMMQSKEWMQKFPVEFNSMLNLIENEGKNNDMMDDTTSSSVAFGSRFADDTTSSSVAFGGYKYVDDSVPSVAFGGSKYVDDSVSSVAFGSRFADDTTSSSVAFGGSKYVDHSAKEPISLVDNSPKADSMNSDYSPCGNLDDPDDELFSPLQRTMSS
jgi:hypothetical protein